MVSDAAITADEASALVTHFYRMMDAHTPVDSYGFVVDEARIVIEHPGARLEGWDAFQRWYDGVTRACFDQVHTINQLELIEPGLPATTQVVARWQASVWRAPAARAESIDAIATHQVVIGRHPANGDPVVLAYIMKDVQYADGSARL